MNALKTHWRRLNQDLSVDRPVKLPWNFNARLERAQLESMRRMRKGLRLARTIEAVGKRAKELHQGVLSHSQ